VENGADLSEIESALHSQRSAPRISSHQHPSDNGLTQRQSDDAFNSVFDFSCNRKFPDSRSKPLDFDGFFGERVAPQLAWHEGCNQRK
jgi:hypothetical protein